MSKLHLTNALHSLHCARWELIRCSNTSEQIDVAAGLDVAIREMEAVLASLWLFE